jgi:hypothetical protein
MVTVGKYDSEQRGRHKMEAEKVYPACSYPLDMCKPKWKICAFSKSSFKIPVVSLETREIQDYALLSLWYIKADEAEEDLAKQRKAMRSVVGQES